MRAANIPVSVIIVKIGKINGENDSAMLIKNGMKTFAQCERTFIDIIDYEQYKNTDGSQTQLLQSLFEFDIIRNIPK